MLKKLKSVKSCLYISYQREKERKRDKKILSDIVDDTVRKKIKKCWRYSNRESVEIHVSLSKDTRGKN